MKVEVSDQFNLLVRAVDLLQKNLKCVICLELLQNPVKTRCRHSFCHCCINGVLKGSNAQCPLCNTHITRRSIDDDVKSASLVTLYKNLIIAIEKDCGINVESYATIERDTREAIFNSPRHKKLSEKKPDDPKLLSIIADTPLLPIASECKNRNTVTEKQLGENKDSNGPISETPKRSLSLENVNHTRGNTLNRYSKSYKSKHNLKATPELPVKKLDGVSCKDKVEHWLQINSGLLEAGFNSPVSNTPELKVNVNFSPVDDDDLISASQVVEATSVVAPENPHKLNSMFKCTDQVDSPNNILPSSSNDPYTFIPSQPTKKPKGKNRITSTASRKGRRISEKIIPSSKRKCVAIGDVTLNNIFCQQIPESQNIADGCNVTVNDTFDNLFIGSKCTGKLQKNEIDMVDDVLLFKTPLDPAAAGNVLIDDVENLSDTVSVSSGEDWPPVGSRKQVRKTAVSRSLAPRTSALSRKSTLQKKSPRNRRKSKVNKCLKNNNDSIELLKNEFKEVDKYKIVTSSQFDRDQEEIKNIDKTTSFQAENQLLDKSEKENNLCKVNKNNKGVPEVNGPETDCIVQNTDAVSKSPGWSRFLEVKKDFRKSTKPSLKALNVSGGSLLPSKLTAVFNDVEDISEDLTSRTAIFNDDVRAMLVRNRSSSEESLDLSGTQGNQKQFSKETLNLGHQSTNMNIYENDICDQETVIFQNRNIAKNVSSVPDTSSIGLPVEKNLNEKQPLLNAHLQNASGNSDESFGPVTHFETPSHSEVKNCVRNALSCLETINLEDCNKSLHMAISSLKSELQRKETMILHENMEKDTFIKELVVEKDNSTTDILCHKNEVESNPKKVCSSRNSPRKIKQNIKDINIKESNVNSNVNEVVESTFPSPHTITFPEEFANVDNNKRLPSVNMQTSDNNSLNLTIKFNLNLNDILRNKNQQFDEISTSCNKEGLSKTRKTFSLLANTEDLNELSFIQSSESTQGHLSTHVANTSSRETHNYKYQNVATQTHQNGIKPHCVAELAFGSMCSTIPVNIDSTIEVSQINKGLHNIKANFWFSYEDHMEKQTSRNEISESQSLSHLPKPNQGTTLTMPKYVTEESQEIEKSVPHKLSNLYTLKTNASQPVRLYSNQNNTNNIAESSRNFSQTRKANGKHVEGVNECTSKDAYNEKDDSENVKETESSTNCKPHHSIDMNLGKEVQSFQEKGKAASSSGSSSFNKAQKLSNTSHTEQVLLTASSLSNGQGLVFPCGQRTTDSQISSGNKLSEENSCNENEINSNKRFNSSMSLFSSSNSDDKPGKGRQCNVETSKEIEKINPSYDSGKITNLKKIRKQDALNCPISNASKRSQCMSDDEEIKLNKKRKLINVLRSDSEESSSDKDNKVDCYPTNQLNTRVLSPSQNTEDLLNSEEIVGKVMAKIDEELGLVPSYENYKEKIPLQSPKRRKLSQPKSPTMFSQPGNAGEDEMINEKQTLHITVDDGDLSSQTRSKLQFTEGKKLLSFHQDSVQEEISVSIPESDDDIVERTPTKVVDITVRDHDSSDKPNVVHDNIQNCENDFKERELKSNLLQQQGQIKMNSKPSDLYGNTSNINVHNDSVSLLHKNINNSKLITAVAKNEAEENLIKKPSDLIIMCSGFSRDMPAKIKNAVVALGAVFSGKFLPTATHLIAKTNEQNCTDKTLKYLQAVAAGKWVVNIEWIKTCVRMNEIVPEGPYEVLDSLAGIGPRRSRLSKEPLFKDFVFCCFGPYLGVTLEELRDLLFVCGALVVQSSIELISRISNYCLIVVGDDNPNLPQLLNKYKHLNIPVVSHEWLLECISTYDIISIWPLLIHPSTLEELQKLHLPAAALEVLDDDETMEEQTFS